jgi:cytoskeletal protein RodZ
MEFDQENSKLDEAVAKRLRRLRAMPVDTHSLESRLREQIGIPRQRSRWLRPMRAVAASVAVLVLAGAIIWSTSGGAVLASPSQMAQMHNELVSGKTTVMQVDSIEAANKALSSQWPQSPGIPSMPSEHVMACCMKSVKNKKVACVLLKNEGVPVTLTVANAGDMRLPTSPTVQRSGLTYHVQAEGALNMVMTERNDRWICLIGELSADKLIELATKLGF